MVIWALCGLEQGKKGEAESDKYSMKSQGTTRGNRHRAVGPEAGEVRGSCNEASESR